MAKKKGGIMNRLIMGKERDEGYARSTLPTNRWSLFWDIFKGRISKLFIVNILMFVTFIPLIFVILMRSNYLTAVGTINPFSQTFGVGYPAFPSIQGYAERLTIQGNVVYYGILMPVASLIASIGLSGGAYVIRNMVWTEGIFVANDFWRGIKINIKLILPTALIYSIVFFLCQFSLSSASLAEALMGKTTFWLVLSKIATYVLFIFSTVMAMYMITLGVTYNLKFRHLLKNAFILTLSLFPINVFFLFLCLIPFLISSFGGIFTLLGYMLLFSLTFSYMLLVWTDYSHFVFDKYINDKIPGAQRNRGIFPKTESVKSEALEQYIAQNNAFKAKSYLDGRPIKPIDDEEIKLAELPLMYTRADLEKLNESKEAMYRDNEEYIKAHTQNQDESVEEVKKELVKKYGVSQKEADELAKNTSTIIEETEGESKPKTSKKSKKDKK